MNNQFEVPYYLAIAIALSIIFLLCFYGIFRNKIKKSWAFKMILFFIGIYIIVIGSAFVLDIYYQISLNEFDLNKNGIFEENEQNKEQQEAYSKFINNTGSNLTIFTGFIYSFIISFIIFITGLIIDNNSKEQKT